MTLQIPILGLGENNILTLGVDLLLLPWLFLSMQSETFAFLSLSKNSHSSSEAIERQNTVDGSLGL